MSHRRFAAWSAVLITLVGLIVLLAGTLPVENSDFYDFYVAALDAMRGKNVYAPQSNGVQGFFNPLWAAFAVVPLTAFDAAMAFQVWRLLLLVILAGAILPLLRLYDIEPGPGWLAVAGWLFLLPWFVGQNAPLVAVGAYLAIVYAARQRWLLAGAMTALMAIKPHTIPFLPLVFVAAGRRRFLAGALAGTATAAATALLVQPDWPLAWVTSQWGQSQAAAGQTWPASALPNVLDYLQLWSELYGLAILGAVAFLWWRRTDSFLQQAATALALGTAVAPYVRAGDFPLLLPALFVLPTRWAAGVVALAVLLFFIPGKPVPFLWGIPGLVAGARILTRWRR